MERVIALLTVLVQVSKRGSRPCGWDASSCRTTEGPQEVLCSSACTISRGPGWHKGRARVASERVWLAVCSPASTLRLLCAPASSCSWEACRLELRQPLEAELQNSMVSPLSKMGTRGEDLIHGEEASREELWKS